MTGAQPNVTIADSTVDLARITEELKQGGKEGRTQSREQRHRESVMEYVMSLFADGKGGMAHIDKYASAANMTTDTEGDDDNAAGVAGDNDDEADDDFDVNASGLASLSPDKVKSSKVKDPRRDALKVLMRQSRSLRKKQKKMLAHVSEEVAAVADHMKFRHLHISRVLASRANDLKQQGVYMGNWF